MTLIENLKNGKYNLILFSILFILIFHSYYTRPTIENFATSTDDVKAAVKEVYLTDIQAIRNLSEVATKLQREGLKVGGNLTATGNAAITSELSSGTIKSGNIASTGDITSTGNITSTGTIKSGDITSTGSINVSGKIKEGGNDLVPKGTIVAFNSTTAPAGWALCDGQNGTPDLRGRFIRMASDNITQEDGATAGFDATIVGRKLKNTSGINEEWLGNSRTYKDSWIFKMKLGDYGGTDHHVLSVNELSTSGTVQPAHQSGKPWVLVENAARWGHNNMPPYYVLTYIMKL